jgi:hypothetical protein
MLVGIAFTAENFGGQVRPQIERSSTGISINAENASLDSILRELSRVLSIESVLLEPGAKTRRVTLKLTDVPESDILTKVLDAADVNYTIWGGEGIPYKLYVGLPGDVDLLPLAPEEYSSESATSTIEPKSSTTTTPLRSRTRAATGFANPSRRGVISPTQRPGRATGSASAIDPRPNPVVLTIAVLGFGLLLGVLLVTPTRRNNGRAP